MFENIRLYSSNDAFLLFFGAKVFLPFFVSSQLYAISRVRNNKGNRWMALFIFLIGVIFINDNEFFATFNIPNTQVLNRLFFIPLFSLPSFFYDLADTMLLSFVAYLGWHIARQRELHPQSVVDVDIDKTDRIESDKLMSMAQAISDCMKERKPYVDVDLTMPQLAAILNISNNELSYILNNHFQENFYTYINRHRIEESKRIMSDPTRMNLSIDGVALESGFRSKSTFYKWFKQLNGLSPGEYRAGDLA